MDRAAPSVESLHALELRVLEGPQGGARAPLSAGVDCVVAAQADGQGAGADIVLREERVAPARVRVQADLAQATLEVLAGEVRLGDQTLAAGQQATWMPHAPLQIGSSVVAFGRACDDDWKPGAPAETASAEAPDDDTPAPTPTPLRRRAEVWLASLGAGVLLSCVGALWMAHVAAAPAPVAMDPAAALVTALRGSEFTALEASRSADGRITLRGRVSTQAQRALLDAWLTERRLAPTVEVWVDEAVAQDVTEVFRVNGVAVRTQLVGLGRVAAEAAEPDTTKLNRATEVVRRDVRGLLALEVRNTAKPTPPPVAPLSDDPGKRIASLVPGEPAYLVTADGSRYFLGALLPSGHRVMQIAKGSLTLELNGQQLILNF
jgi:type III secretion protein D